METVRVIREGAVAIIELDRPERHHALNETMWSALDTAVRAVAEALPRAVVITGTGDRAFCAGMDVRPDNPLVMGLIEAVQKRDRGPVEKMLRRLRGIVDRLVALPVPVIAAVNGLAYGGGAEIAARCDLRVADPMATICFQEVRLGLMPDLGGGVALAHLLGPARAADLVLTARKVGAEEALWLGLVNKVSAQGECRAEALAMARAIAENGPQAVRASLAIVRQSAELSMSAALELELDKACDLIAGGECAVGIPATMSKTRPNFPDPVD